jgi:hypothetical protein
MIKKIALAFSLALSTLSTTAAELNLSLVQPSDKDFETSAKVSLRTYFNDNYYLFSSIQRQKQLKLTQSFGDLTSYTLGVGFQEHLFGDFSWFAQLGYNDRSQSLNDFSAKEGIFYTFVPLFGVPPFRADKYFEVLEYEYETSGAPEATLGLKWEGRRIGYEASYTFLDVKEQFTIWNPTWNGGRVSGDDHACGCLWTGSSKLNMSTFNFGINYKF